MATRGSSPNPASIARKSTLNSRRPSATVRPAGAASSGGGVSTTASSAAATPASSRPASPAQPMHDLSSLLNLPLRLTLVANGAIPERTVEGSLWTYDAALSLVVLSTASPSPSASTKRSYTLVKTPQIKAVVVLSTAPDPALPSLAEALKNVSLKDAEARVERAVAEDRKQRARVGKGVSEEAQALFDALGKTLPVRWHETQIVVLDEVIIGSPYGVADVKGGKGAGERIERVRKVFKGYPVKVDMYDGRVITGIIVNVNAIAGTVELEKAVVVSGGDFGSEYRNQASEGNFNGTNGHLGSNLQRVDSNAPLLLQRVDICKFELTSNTKTPAGSPGPSTSTTTNTQQPPAPAPKYLAERVPSSTLLTNAFAQQASVSDPSYAPTPLHSHTAHTAGYSPHAHVPAEQPESELDADDSPKPRKQRGGVRRNKKGKGSGNQPGGNEADESTTPYDDRGPDRGSIGTGSSRSRNSRDAPTSHHAQKQAFDDEFDFSAALATFDKAKEFAKIKIQDDTDPSLRLVAHNRNRTQPKLAINENVLSPEELAEQNREQSSADETSDYGDEESRAPPAKPVERERRGTLLKPSSNGASVRRTFYTPTGIKVADVRLRQLKEALSIADIETGPSAIQRAENAGRGIAAFILQTLSRDRGLFPLDQRRRPSICIMTGDCQKGAVALRAGAHLSNHGCKVVSYLLKTDVQTDAFKTTLREFSSSGGRILRDLEDLQGLQFDLLIDAIADNDVQATLGEKTTADLAAATWASQTGVPILSIDSALGTDHDTGAPTTASPLKPAYVACLGAVRSGCGVGSAEVVLVDIGISPSLWPRVGVEEWDAATFGFDFVVALQ
ncbi:hypothetical protein RQP46_006030 [Phenoliferia psychrophenolica]